MVNVLPALTHFSFKGVSEYLKVVVARIDALNSVNMCDVSYCVAIMIPAVMQMQVARLSLDLSSVQLTNAL